MRIPSHKINLNHNGISIEIRREDLIHPFISGNKFRKLKYNLLQAKKDNKNNLLTFGGAFSNHIAAVAFAGKEQGFHTIGIIRGEELQNKIQENPTLQFAQQHGMQLEFIPRNEYANKTDGAYLEKLKHQFCDFFLIPEGGTNELAIKGCEEILSPEDKTFDFICCAIGTGGTISGIINASFENQKVLGFPALKGGFLTKEITTFVNKNNWELIEDYHFGGYAKITPELVSFLNQFFNHNKIPLDPVYTGKMMYGIIDLVQKNYFPPNSKILVIHTGGLQGIEGMNQLLSKKNLPKIEYHV
ncbi:pyridoxal-phosphate dependent enzyme [Flavobacterium sp. NST-5]|uniref:Pyridoxal-phosphate dependent enzyme n=2 Tax=Flavobacterium ichthyis TaxID=2698827 RepID=A0ABW9Z872_9FLAO|nr:pyridoxal-phosphate dependent enzyme [Flavobacterium ichthyis]NBL64391.1 pyridoxal-phosphate dependent enzyme [Flavobacterium ichthyis]